MVHPRSFESGQSSKLLSRSEPVLQFHLISLFPEVFKTVLESSLLGKAQKKGLVTYSLTQIRDFARDKHRTVDDTPFGGSEGMLLKPDILCDAWESVMQKVPVEETPKLKTILLSPQGRLLDQALARELAQSTHLILVCGHYEGVDERFIELCVDQEVSIGDYVLTGGELPALVLVDAVTRLVPGVVGNERSITEESLENGLLKYPQYTRPREFRDLKVPDVLLSGDHGAIGAWRQNQMLDRTEKKRPDLWQKFSLKSKSRR